MTHNNTKSDKLKMLPIIPVLTVIPFILYYHAYPTHLDGYDWQAATLTYDVDLFLYGKGFCLCMVALLMLGVFLYTRQYRKGMVYETMPLLMYAILIGFSTLCSKYQYFTLHGCQDQFESIWVLFAYLITAVYVMYVLDEEHHVRIAVHALLIGGAIMTVIGILQMLKLDPFRTDIFKTFLLFWTGQNNMTFNTPEGMVYASLFNQNYVGAYACIVIPCAVGVAIAAQKKLTKILCSILAAGLLVCTFGANAKNGIIALTLCGLLMLVIYRKILLRHLQKMLLAVGVVAVFLVGVNFLTGNVIGNSFINIYSNFLASATPTEQRLTDVVTGDEELELVLKDDSLHIQYQVNADGTVLFGIRDEEGNEISYQADGTMVNLMDERFSDIKLEPCMIGDVYAFTVYIDDLTWDFSNQVNDGTFYFYNYANKWVKLHKAESAVFTNYSQLFSGRGYIWAKTLPLLKHYIFIGSGPDTFQLVFPQYDYVDLAYKFAPNMLITRAHSMYLQIAVQTGVISLICFLVFYGMYFYKSCRIYIRREYLMEKEPWLFHIGTGIFVGSFGYMLSGIVNDSLPVTAPLFWCIMGMGIAVNTLLMKKYGKEKKEIVESSVLTEDVKKKTANIPVRKKKLSRKERKKH